MLAVTVRSCIEELRPLGHKHCEIIVVDNSDQKYYNLLGSTLPSGYVRERLLKVYRQDFPCIFTARELAAEKSLGKYILCVDSHMIIGHNMFLDLYNFMEENRNDPTIGFAHAPVNWAHQHERASKHDRDMSECELGNWGIQRKEASTITWKGMPWICRRDWFLDSVTGLGGYGALSQYKLSWGGGDMHIGIKPWLLGFKNWAVPTSPGIHIGPFPKIDLGNNPNASKIAKVTARDRYRVWAISGEGPHSLGFLVSCYILGGESMMERNCEAIRRRFGQFIKIEDWWEKAKELGRDEKEWLDERKVMSFEHMLKDQPWNSDANQPLQECI